VSHKDYTVFLTCFYPQCQQLFPYKVNPVPRRKGSFIGDSEVYATSRSRNRCLFPQLPRSWATWRDAPFLVPLGEGKNFFIYGNFYEEFE